MRDGDGGFIFIFRKGRVPDVTVKVGNFTTFGDSERKTEEFPEPGGHGV